MNKMLSEKEAIQAAQRAYKKEWRKNNPEKVKEHARKYWLKKAEEMNLIPDFDSVTKSRAEGAE
ncbi:hypothetical protein LJB90_01825 [Eubacteriales bacterium OttesenSCG-928-G02]|nr:hypothetical protein [Eubacteriales bacterium OttesenSCG-928-G02]